MISKENIICLDYIYKDETEKINEIVSHTVNTWQQDRTYNVKKNDTSIGKKAEDIIEYYVKKNINDLLYISYDDFRNDNFEKHAPFDGLLLSKNFNKEELFRIIQLINEDIKNGQYGKLHYTTKQEIIKYNIKIVEIKSTRITDRHKNNNTIIFEVILEDDFLTYPKYLRIDKYGSLTEEKYYEYCKRKNNKYFINEELYNMSDIYIRIYMDEQNSKGYIIGWIDTNTFFKMKKMKKMPKPGKSEKAVYWATNLKNGYPISDLTIKF